MNSTEQQFFNALEAKLWTAANKLLPSLDAAVYKHIVLGLLFIKYVSDAFKERQKELKTQFSDPAHDYFMNPAEYPGTFDEDLAAELEVRDTTPRKTSFGCPVRRVGRCWWRVPSYRLEQPCRGTSLASQMPKKCVP